jgi:stage 0 sporulation regulatory protein
MIKKYLSYYFDGDNIRTWTWWTCTSPIKGCDRQMDQKRRSNRKAGGIQMVTITDLEKEIETLRKKMIAVGMTKGFTHPETVQVSQELDELMNRAQVK